MSIARKPHTALKTPPFNKRPLAIALQACCYTLLSGAPVVLAAPTGGAVVGGNGSISQSGTNTTIHQNTQNLAINWQTFNVAANERVQFIQPNASSVALNRILSNNGSTIAGRIDANGKVILANPNGILFTSTASLNVGSLIASGLDIKPSDFMNGNYLFNEIPGGSGTVINNGMINAALGGNVALLGKRVENNGLIVAHLGSVTLAAGKQAVLTFDQGGLLGVRVSQEILQSELGVDPAVLNTGEIRAHGGRVLLTASQSQDVFSRAVNTAGLEPATSVVMHDDGTFTLGAGADVVNSGSIDTSTTAANQNGGRIVLLGENVTSSGILKADAQRGNGGEIELHAKDTTLLTQKSLTSARSEAEGKGGIVKVLGDKVGLFDQSQVDVSGAIQGGQALIGGDQEGKNSLIRNANFVYLSEQSQVSADGLNTGNGGKIITFATDTARIYGSLYARGGVNGGNGGFIETSGLRGLEILKGPDASASYGVAGMWLIDPYDLTITGGAVTTNINTSSPFVPNGNSAILGVNLIATALAGGSSVTITTGSSGSQNGDITWDANADLNYNGIGTSSTLTLNAARNITFQAGSRIYDGTLSSSDKLNVTLIAAGTVQLDATASISTNGGNFYVGYDGTTVTRVASFANNGVVDASGTNNLNGGNIRVYTTGNISSTNLSANGGTAVQVSGTGMPGLNGGNVIIDGGGSISLANVSTRGSDGNFNNNDASGVNGGVGGSVNIATSGAVGITVTGTINTSGGNGSGDTQTGNGADPGSGGNAGSVTVGAVNGAVSLGGIIANGGTAIGSGGTPTGGTGGPVSVTGNSIQLNGDVRASGGTVVSGSTSATQGNGGNIDFIGQVSLGANTAVNASGNIRGNISFSNTINGPFSLDLTGRIVTLNGAVGNTGRLGFLTVDAHNAINTGALTVNSLNVIQSSSFTSGAINTFGAALAGGAISIMSDGAVSVGAINSSSTGAAGGNITINASDVTLNGDINSAGAPLAGSGTVNVTLNNPGTVTINHTGNFSSAISIAGSGGSDTLAGANRANTWNIDAMGADYDGTLNGNISFSGIESLTGNSGTDTVTLASALGVRTLDLNNVGFTSIDVINANNGSTLMAVNGRTNNWNIDGTNRGILNENTADAITFTGFSNVVGGNATDNFTVGASGRLATLDGAGGANTLTLNGATGSIMTLSTGTFRSTTLAGAILSQADYSNINTVTANSGGDAVLGALNAPGMAFTVNAAGNISDTGVYSLASLTLNTPGSITLDNQDSIAGGNFNANAISLTTNNGIASLTTTAAILDITNQTGLVDITNTGNVSTSVINSGNIIFTNNSGDVTIRQLNAFGGRGNDFRNPTPYGGNITLTINGGSAYSADPVPAVSRPVIVAHNFTGVMPSGDFGQRGRPISAMVSGRFSLLARRAYYLFGTPAPFPVDINADVSLSYDSIGFNGRLLEIDSLDEFDPAIFTDIRNYYYEDVAIMMPADQRLDGTDEEEEKEGGKEGS